MGSTCVWVLSEHVEMNVQVECGAQTLNQGHRTGQRAEYPAGQETDERLFHGVVPRTGAAMKHRVGRHDKEWSGAGVACTLPGRAARSRLARPSRDVTIPVLGSSTVIAFAGWTEREIGGIRYVLFAVYHRFDRRPCPARCC